MTEVNKKKRQYPKEGSPPVQGVVLIDTSQKRNAMRGGVDE